MKKRAPETRQPSRPTTQARRSKGRATEEVKENDSRDLARAERRRARRRNRREKQALERAAAGKIGGENHTSGSHDAGILPAPLGDDAPMRHANAAALQSRERELFMSSWNIANRFLSISVDNRTAGGEVVIITLAKSTWQSLGTALGAYKGEQ